MEYKQYFSDLKSCLKHYAQLKADIVKHRALSAGRRAWDEVTLVSADSKWGDIVKDYSVDTHYGHVGVVSDTERFTKRDGRQAIRICIQFINHTTVNHSPDVKTRKLEFILPDENGVRAVKRGDREYPTGLANLLSGR
jgi:hypothetical protein